LTLLVVVVVVVVAVDQLLADFVAIDVLAAAAHVVDLLVG